MTAANSTRSLQHTRQNATGLETDLEEETVRQHLSVSDENDPYAVCALALGLCGNQSMPFPQLVSYQAAFVLRESVD